MPSTRRASSSRARSRGAGRHVAAPGAPSPRRRVASFRQRLCPFTRTLPTLSRTVSLEPTRPSEYAFATSVIVPDVPVVSHVNEYGATVSVPYSTPFTHSSTLVIGFPSVAVTFTGTIPETVEPFSGELIAVAGARLSRVKNTLGLVAVTR